MSMQETIDGLTVAADGAVITVTLDRPDGNLITQEMAKALTQLLLDPPAEAHVLVLRGAGASFCLGRERGATTTAEVVDEVQTLIALNQALHHTSLATVARVHGDAAGFGAGLASLCDVTVVCQRAGFLFPEVTIGLAPALVLAWLPKVVGRRRAFWMAASGETVRGEALVASDLANEAVDDEAALDVRVSAVVSELTSHSPRVHREIRQMIDRALDLTQDQAYALSSPALVVGSLRRGES